MNDLPSCSTPLGVGKAANLSINPYFVRRIPPFLKGGSFKIYLLSFIFLSSIFAEDCFVYPHGEIKQYSMHGNFQKGLATEGMGAKQFEVWRASIAVGSKTPLHAHETEEIFIVLKGKMLVLIGEEEVECTAPATLICPANVPHQLINIGDEPTDHILVLGVGSTIWNENGEEMKLPWR